MGMVTDYSTALIALLIFVLVVLVQAAMVGAAKANAGVTPGSNPETDYDNKLYRLHRSHQNGVENLAAVATAVIACVLVGASSWWVNLLMGLFLVGRGVYLLIYSRNMGKPTQGIRTGIFVFSWACVVVMCVMAIWKLM